MIFKTSPSEKTFHYASAGMFFYGDVATLAAVFFRKTSKFPLWQPPMATHNPDGKSLKTQVYGHHSYPDYRFGSGPGAKSGKIFTD
jgi:hypothetical protein